MLWNHQIDVQKHTIAVLNSPEAVESDSPVVKRELNIIVLRCVGFRLRELWLELRD